MIAEKYPNEWKKVPYYNQIDQHILAMEMNQSYCEERFNQIKEISPIHKLTNKTENLAFEENSYYSKLNQLYK